MNGLNYVKLDRLERIAPKILLSHLVSDWSLCALNKVEAMQAQHKGFRQIKEALDARHRPRRTCHASVLTP